MPCPAPVSQKHLTWKWGPICPTSTPRAGKLRPRGGTSNGLARSEGQSSLHPTPFRPCPRGQVSTHQGPPPGFMGSGGRQAGWHTGSRSQVPKPGPPSLHGQREILAPPKMTSPPTQSSMQHLLQEALHPPCPGRASAAPAPAAGWEPSAPGPPPRTVGPWVGPGLCLQD